MMAGTVATLALAGSAVAQQGIKQTSPIDTTNLDRSVSACTDFYQFANGGWLARNQIPAAYSQWGSFMELRDDALDAEHSLLDSIMTVRTTASDPTVRKLGNFYASCMDTTRIEQLGATPLKKPLAEISAIKTSRDVANYVTSTQAHGFGVLFNFGSTQDARNSTEMIAGLYQGGLSLPDRDYYLKTDAKSASIRGAYLTHVAKLFVLAGETPANASLDAQTVMRMETALATASLTRVEERDPEATYNRRTPAQLATMAPDFDWKAFYTAMRLAPNTPVTVEAPKFLTAVDSMLRNTSVADWKTYFRWNMIRSTAPLLSKAFVDEDFAFNQVLSGAKEQLPRYKKCLTATDGMMGEALGKAYVDKYFTPAAKASALQMVHNLQDAFHDRLATRAWMSDSTRQGAYAKLNAFMDKIGYPDKWQDYTSLDVRPNNSWFDNVIAARYFSNDDDLKKIGKPVDRTKWGMTPPTVNAYYNPAMNEIVFPAGILQPPFFDPKADDAVNYGGIGAVIGHEMTHGFDDQGAQYDAQGNLRQWFTTADMKSFKDRTSMVAKQFDNYTILDSLHINGNLTLGENIADFGGLTIAYAALEKDLQGKPRTLVDGFTPEQRFFLAWAQVWRNNTRPENARMRLTVDPHSPGVWRTNGPLSNMPEFAKAWGCKVGDPMVRPPELQAVIW
jgi:putative endopeptidase